MFLSQSVPQSLLNWKSKKECASQCLESLMDIANCIVVQLSRENVFLMLNCISYLLCALQNT